MHLQLHYSSNSKGGGLLSVIEGGRVVYRKMYLPNNLFIWKVCPKIPSS